MSRVLLTGAAGFIGRHVHAELIAAGYEVRPLDSLRADVHRHGRPEIADLVVADVRDAEACLRALDGVDAVCHLAAKVGLGVDVYDIDDYADSNVRGTSVLLAAMARADVGVLVQASSMVVYGEGAGICSEHAVVAPAARRELALQAGDFEPPCPLCGRLIQPARVNEAAELRPRNAYAASKVGQEQFAQSWARLTGGAVSSLRYHNVYGPGMPIDTPYAGVAAVFLTALRHDQPPRVFEDGGQQRDFVHVRDVARASVAALGTALSGEPAARAWNVGSGQTRTVGELAASLARATGGPSPLITGQYRLGDVRHIVADSTSARAELDWQCIEDFDAGMAELAADFHVRS